MPPAVPAHMTLTTSGFKQLGQDDKNRLVADAAGRPLANYCGSIDAAWPIVGESQPVTITYLRWNDVVVTVGDVEIRATCDASRDVAEAMCLAWLKQKGAVA